jgi:WD40 repeat protein
LQTHLDIGTGRISKLPMFDSLAGFVDMVVSTKGIIAAIDANGIIWLSDPNSNETKKIKTNAINVAIAPDGQHIAYLTRGNEIHVCDTGGRNDHRFSTEDAGSQDINQLRFSPDGVTLASLGDEIFLWNSESKRLFKRGTVSHAYIADAAFSPNGRTLISASFGGTILCSRMAPGRNFGRSMGVPLRVIEGEWRGIGKADISDNSEVFACIIGNGNSIMLLSSKASDLTFPSLGGKPRQNAMDEMITDRSVSELLNKASEKVKVNLTAKISSLYMEQ